MSCSYLIRSQLTEGAIFCACLLLSWVNEAYLGALGSSPKYCMFNKKGKSVGLQTRCLLHGDVWIVFEIQYCDEIRNRGLLLFLSQNSV